MERFCTLMACTVIVAVALCFDSNSQAIEPTWINHPDIRFSVLEQLASGEERPKTIAGNANRDCYMREVVIRPSRIQSYPINSSEIRQTVCGQDTMYGFLSGVFMRTGTEVAGKFIHGNLGLVVGPNLTSGILINPDGNIFILPNLANRLVTVKNSFGEVEHRINDASKMLDVRVSNGARVYVAYDTMSFSANGKWMLADAPGHGQVRINTETAEVLSFGRANDYNKGYVPLYQTAISSDGRYAIFVSGFHQTFRIYDLESCTGQASYSPQLNNCQYRDLQEMFLDKVNYGVSPTQIRFSRKNEVTFYSGIMNNGVRQWRQYRMTMGDVPRFGFEYLGLGDSFASGEGYGQYKPATDDQKANMCHTSMISYPLLAGMQLGKEKYDTIACSGAVIDDIYQVDPKRYKGQAQDGMTQEQRRVDEIIASMLPGKITQDTYVNEGLNPEVVTISIGGNSIGFDDKIRSCILDARSDTTCFNTYEDRLEVVKEIEIQIPRLEQTYRKLAANGRKVYVLGYPKIVDPNGNCAEKVPLDNSETDFADKLVIVLNGAIKTATKRAGVVYVDVENILVGHRLCETNSKDAYVHGLTGGDETGLGPLKFLSKASFHPKAAAGPLYKDAIINQTDSLTKPMPKPDSSAAFIVPASGDRYWQAEHNGRNTFLPKAIQAVPNLVIGQPTKITVDDVNGWLKPETDVSVELHSSPVFLGTFKTDATGSLIAQITIPHSVKPGFHSVHIYGQNVAGQLVDLYQYLYVLAGETDADGDGITDENDPCTFIEPIGADMDRDGIDDGCDTSVTEPPIRVGLPTDIGLGNDPKEFLNESQAGNEEIISNSQLAMGNAFANSNDSIGQDSQSLIANSLQFANSQLLIGGYHQPEVLGVVTDKPGQVQVPTTLAHGPLPHPKPTKNWLSIGALSIFIFLPALLVYARLRSH